MNNGNNPHESEDACINVNQDQELQYWSNKFDVTKEELIEAVGSAGSHADDVETHLRTQDKDYFAAL